MPNRDVRTIGYVTDVHGRRLPVGVDYDAADIFGHPISLSAEDDFMKLAMRSFADARKWAADNPQEDEAVEGGEPWMTARATPTASTTTGTCTSGSAASATT